MPGGVQNFLVEVQAVDADLVLSPLGGGAHLARLQYCSWLGDLLGRLQRNITFRIPVEHFEEVVVRAGHDGLVVARPAALELVEYAIVLVQRTQFRAQVLVRGIHLDRPGLHVQIPHLDGQIVARNHVSAGIRDFHVRHARYDLGEETSVGRIFGFFKYCKKNGELVYLFGVGRIRRKRVLWSVTEYGLVYLSENVRGSI